MAKTTAAMIALCGVGGCSLVGVKGPTSMPDPVECTDDRGLPYVDTVVAATAALAIGYALSPASGEGEARGKGLIALIALPIGLIAAGSAVYGHLTVSSCIDAKKRHQQEEQTKDDR